jgi:hypothetical protein
MGYKCFNCKQTTMEQFHRDMLQCTNCGAVDGSNTRRHDKIPVAICDIDGTPFKQELHINRRNLDSDVTGIMCEQGHTILIEIPISTFQRKLRAIKSIKYRLRNYLFNEIGLCQCTNTLHNHRKGIHGFEPCNKCDATKHPE